MADDYDDSTTATQTPTSGAGSLGGILASAALHMIWQAWFRQKKQHKGKNQPIGYRYPSNQGGITLPTRRQADPIEGYRTWRIRMGADGYALHSLMYSYEWGLENEARCMVAAHDELAPAPHCSCGFYISKPDTPLTEWDSHVFGRPRAYGTADLSGRVIVCDMGYKAQYASIVSPVFIDVECRGPGSGRCLNAVTRILVSGTDHYAYCDEHRPGKQDAVLVDAKVWMGECLRQLRARYPGVEFLTFMEV